MIGAVLSYFCFVPSYIWSFYLKCGLLFSSSYLWDNSGTRRVSSLKLHLIQAKSGFRSCPPQTNPPGHLSGLSYWIASLQESPWIISCIQVIRPHFLDIVLYICYCSIFFSCVFNPGLLVGTLQKWTLLECLLVLNLSSPFCIVQDCLWREESHPPSRCILPCQFVLSS